MGEAELPDELRALLAFIRGEGHPYGPGMRTYPSSPAEEERAEHAACLELERRGLIARRIDDPDLATWIPKGASDGDDRG